MFYLIHSLPTSLVMNAKPPSPIEEERSQETLKALKASLRRAPKENEFVRISFRDAVKNSAIKRGARLGDYHTSASSWTVKALHAFRVVPLLGLPPADVLPGYKELDDDPSGGKHRSCIL